MKTIRTAAALAASLVLLASPFAAYAQVYYYAPGTTSGAYNYDSYIPAAAMPYVNMGYQMQQQYQGHSYPSTYSYSYPMQSQSQYQYQSQTQYQPQYQTSYPTYSYGYNTSPSYGYSYGYNQYGEYSSEPRSVSYPSGTVGPFGTQMCYWSDSTTYEPCGQDPQQWIQDPYTGGWY